MIQCRSCNRGFEPPAGSDIPDRCPSCGSLILGPYCDLQWVGGGGMGDVYKAREPEMGDRFVAIKIPRSQTNVGPVWERFEREIHASGRLQHENAVRVYRRDQERERPYLVMEFVSGQKLSDVIRKAQPLACRRVARVLLGIARGLEHGETVGVVNRDIKPENIFLTAPEETAKILDYGLALIAKTEEQVTRHGTILGTPSYTAPEQFLDPHVVTIAADVYSLGCTAYCCLTGKRPFEARTPDEIWRQHSEAPRPQVRAVRADVPEPFDELIRKMMAIEYDKRPTPRQVVAALQGLIPLLDEHPPWLPGAADTTRITVCCLGCGDEYYLAATTAGKKMRCANKLCNTVFVVPAPGEPVAPEAEAPPGPAEGLTAILQAMAPEPTIDQPVDVGQIADLPGQVGNLPHGCKNGEVIEGQIVAAGSDGDAPLEPLVFGELVEGEFLPIVQAKSSEHAATRDTPAGSSGTVSTGPGGLDVVRPSASRAAAPAGGPEPQVVTGIPVFLSPSAGEKVEPPPVSAFVNKRLEEMLVRIERLRGEARDTNRLVVVDNAQKYLTAATADAADIQKVIAGHLIPLLQSIFVLIQSARMAAERDPEWVKFITEVYQALADGIRAVSDGEISEPRVGDVFNPSENGRWIAVEADTRASVTDQGRIQKVHSIGLIVAGDAVVMAKADIESLSQAAAPRPKPATAKPRKSKQDLMAGVVKILVGAALAVTVLLFAGWYFLSSPPPDPWEEITRLVTEHKWAQAQKKLEKFENKFPEDPHIEQAPFFKDLCEAGPEIYGTTGDPARGLEIIQGLFRNHRDNTAYKEYCGELYKGLAELMGRFVDRADETADSRELKEARKAHDVLKQGREVHELYATVAAAMTPEAMQQALSPEQVAKVGQTPQEAEQLLDKTERSIRSKIAGLELQLLKGRATDPKQTADLDSLYREIRKQFAIWRSKAESELDGDEEYRKLSDGLRKSEYVRIAFERDDPTAAPAEVRAPGEDVGRQGNTLVVAWSKRGGAAPPAGTTDDAVLALARGILYVFDAQGQLRWSRRLGLDSFRLPQVVRGSQALIAVSSEDQSLLALETGSPDPGRVRWRYPVGQDIAAPLTVARLREDPNRPYSDFGLLPTARGEVHVLELFRGRRIGRFLVGQPLTVGGVHWRPEKAGPEDPLRANGLVFFPADRERIFALNPSVLFAKPDAAAPAGERQQAACRYVLFTRHPSGSLRGEPMVVGRYLVLSEAELEHTRLRVFQVGDRDYRDLKAATERRLHGWAWFPPHGTPDRVALVTDAGDLGIFGFNLDNPTENMYHVVAEESQLAPDLSFRDAARTLVVHGEEHLLWIMAGGRLQLYAIDVIHQKIRPVWKNRDPRQTVAGIPVHEAQVDRRSGTIYLTTMSPGGMTYGFSAVEAMTGSLRWQRQLGMSIQGDPLVWQNNVLLIDRGGQKLTLRPSADPVFNDRPRMVQPSAVDPLPEGMDENQVLRLGGPPEKVYLVATDQQRSKLAVRAIHPPKTETEDWSAQPWTVLPLPARETLCGRPCILDDTLVVPCLYPVQGQVSLKMFSLSGAPPRGDVRQYTWTPAYPPSVDGVELYALDKNAILVVEGRRSLTRLELRTTAGVTQWDKGVTDRDPDGRVYHLRDPLVDRPLVHGSELVAFDAQGTCYRLDVNNPRRELAGPSATGLRLERAPFLRGDFLLAIDGDNRILALAAGQGPLAGKPSWISQDEQRRRILGEPALVGDTLLVADNSCHVTGIGLRDGKTRWKVPLKVHVGPAAAAVSYGPNHMLIPLADGTLLVLPIPKTELAEAGK